MSKVQKQSPGTQPGTNRVQVENEPGITTSDASVRESNLSEITPAQTDIIQELELIIAGGEYE